MPKFDLLIRAKDFRSFLGELRKNIFAFEIYRPLDISLMYELVYKSTTGLVEDSKTRSNRKQEKGTLLHDRKSTSNFQFRDFQSQ